MANVANLVRVREAIKAHPDNFDYSVTLRELATEYGIPKDTTKFSTLIHGCGTMGCIVGYTNAVADPNACYSGWGWDAAVNYLGITYEEADWLFQPEQYDEDDYFDMFEDEPSLIGYKVDPDFKGYNYCNDKEGLAEALRRIDHLIAYYSVPSQS